MTSNTTETSGNFRAVPLADQLVGVKPIKGPIEMALGYDGFILFMINLSKNWRNIKKQHSMDEIKEAGNDYEI